MKWRLFVAFIVAMPLAARAAESDWLSWSAKESERIIRSATATGRVAGGRRLLNTERAHSYKVTAVWISPDVMAASARLLQLRDRLSDPDALRELQIGFRGDETVFLIDLDPNEGSGVIPRDWSAFLQIRGQPERIATGTLLPSLADVKVAHVIRRNYDYDRFWVAFPRRTSDGGALFRQGDREAELIVRLREREGRLTFPVPNSLIRDLSERRPDERFPR